MIKKITAIFVLFALFINLFGCNSQKETKSTGIYFDTSVTLSAYGEKLPASLWQICEKYDKLFSATDKSSDIFMLNTLGCCAVNADTADIIEKSLNFCDLTDGKLDITVYPLKMLWGFYTDYPAVPEPSQIEETRKKINYKNVSVDGNTVTLTDGVQLDLGAVAKGYIADKLANEYQKNKLVGIIDLGGNIMLPLSKENGKPFIIGIKDPQNTENIKLNISVMSGAVVTSGTYERAFSEDGKTYHHILDVTTGYPAQTEIESVTVIAPSAMTADALSTAIICMGEDDGLQLVNTLGDTHAIIIKNDGSVVLSDGLRQNGNEITVA